MKLTGLTALLLLTALYTTGQKKEYDLSSLLSKKKLTVVNRTASLLKDQPYNGVHLDDNSTEGIAWINDVTFTSGTIEIDLRGKDVLQRSFIGVAFLGVNDSTYDAVYFRPFNFHSTDPVRKIHAVQYISHPTYTWRKLRDEQNGMYEKALVNPPKATSWFHARIEIKNDEVNVFVNNDTTPSLTVKKLSNATSGKIGIWTGAGSDGDFANLIISN